MVQVLLAPERTGIGVQHQLPMTHSTTTVRDTDCTTPGVAWSQLHVFLLCVDTTGQVTPIPHCTCIMDHGEDKSLMGTRCGCQNDSRHLKHL